MEKKPTKLCNLDNSNHKEDRDAFAMLKNHPASSVVKVNMLYEQQYDKLLDELSEDVDRKAQHNIRMFRRATVIRVLNILDELNRLL